MSKKVVERAEEILNTPEVVSHVIESEQIIEAKDIPVRLKKPVLVDKYLRLGIIYEKLQL